MKTDKSQNIFEENRLFKVLGFIEDDLVLGVTLPEESSEWNGQGEIPVSEIRIVSADSEVKLSYKKENLYFSNFTIAGNQLRFDEYSHDENGYHYAGKDSVLSNKETEQGQNVKRESRQLGSMG